MKYTLFVFFGLLCIIELNALNHGSKSSGKMPSQSKTNVHTKKETSTKEIKGKKQPEKSSSSTKKQVDPITKAKEKIKELKEKIKDKIKDIVPKTSSPGKKEKTTERWKPKERKTSAPWEPWWIRHSSKPGERHSSKPWERHSSKPWERHSSKPWERKITDPKTEQERKKIIDKIKEKFREKMKHPITEAEIKKMINKIKEKIKNTIPEKEIKKILDDLKNHKIHPKHPINTDPTMKRIIEELRRKPPVNDPILKKLMEDFKRKHKMSDPEMKKIMNDLKKRMKNPVVKPSGPVKQTVLPSNKNKDGIQKIIDFLKSKKGCGYAFGSEGQTLTPDLLKQFKRNFGNNVKDSTKKWMNQECYDCSGLTMKALQQVGIKVHHNAQATWANDLKQRGDIKDIPEDKLCLVFKKGSNGEMHHIGIYIGDGKVIEAKGADYGVVETNLKDGHWTNWGMTAGLE